LTCQACFTVLRVVKYAFQVDSRIRELRMESGLSQQGLAEQVGVSRQTINSLEKGRYDPSLKLAVHLARFFGSTVEEVFDVDG
jgi:putative transcriptional regulator